MPIGMPGCPDFAASTASMARARMELASAPSVALAVTGDSMGGRKLYSAHAPPSLQQPGRFRTLRSLRRPRRGALVRLPRRPAARRNGAARAAVGRSAGAGEARLGPCAVAKKPQLVGVHRSSTPISWGAQRNAMLAGGAAGAGRGAWRDDVAGPAHPVLRPR